MSVEVIVRITTRSGQTIEMPLDEGQELYGSLRKVPVLTAVDASGRPFPSGGLAPWPEPPSTVPLTVSNPTLSMQETVPPDTDTPKTVAQLAEEQKQVNAIPSIMPKPFAGKALPIQTPPAAETKPENPTEVPPSG